MKEYLSIEDYELIATKIIRSWRTRWYMPRCVENDQDLLGNVTTAIMKADWTYDNNKTTHSLKSYRTTCAINAIKHYMQRYRNNQHFVKMTDLSDVTYYIDNYILDKDTSYSKKLLRDLIYSSELTPKQIKIMSLIGEGWRTKDIANELKTSLDKLGRLKRLAIQKMRAIALKGV